MILLESTYTEQERQQNKEGQNKINIEAQERQQNNEGQNKINIEAQQ